MPWVFAQGADGWDSWIITAALPGESAVSDRWKANPGRAVQALGAGLRALHEALPVQTWPFSWSVHDRLDDAGVADRWADLAIATWSTKWNYGPGWDGPVLAAYGVDADPERVAYYRLLWDLGP